MEIGNRNRSFFPLGDVKHLRLPGENGSSNDHLQAAAQCRDHANWLWSQTSGAQAPSLSLTGCVTWSSYLTSLSLIRLIMR